MTYKAYRAYRAYVLHGWSYTYLDIVASSNIPLSATLSPDEGRGLLMNFDLWSRAGGHGGNRILNWCNSVTIVTYVALSRESRCLECCYI